MVHDPVKSEPLECAECMGTPSFLIIPTGAAPRDWDGKRRTKPSVYSCGRDLTKLLRRTPNHAAIVRVLD